LIFVLFADHSTVNCAMSLLNQMHRAWLWIKKRWINI